MFSPRRAADLCMQALAALTHAHAAGVVHRDLKPGNILVTESGSIKIMDFGIARLEGAINLTNVGQMLGTPAYMAPEQVLGHPVDSRADLYAMGVVFFRLITAAFPFKGENPFDMAQAQVKDAPAKASDMRPDLPAWTDEIVARAMAKAPAQRFQSAMEFHEAFARATGEAPSQVTPIAVPALERTEVMARPDFSHPPSAASQPIATAGPKRSHTASLTIAVAAAVLAGLVGCSHRLAQGPPDAQDDPPIVASPPKRNRVTRQRRHRCLQQWIPVARRQRRRQMLEVRRRHRQRSRRRCRGRAPKPVLPPASFKNVKLLTVNGSRSTASDAALLFQKRKSTLSRRTRRWGRRHFAIRRSRKRPTSTRDPQWIHSSAPGRQDRSARHPRPCATLAGAPEQGCMRS